SRPSVPAWSAEPAPGAGVDSTANPDQRAQTMKHVIGVWAAWLGAVALAPAADVAGLVKQLKDSKTEVRRSAAEELGKAAKDPAAEAPPALTAALKDSDLFVRALAAQALGAIGAAPKTAVPALTAALKTPREKTEVIEAVVAALGKMGTAAVPSLSELADD